MMFARYIPKIFSGKIRDPFSSEHDPIYALLTAGAFVAVADGRVDSAERKEAVRYIDQVIRPKMTKARIADCSINAHRSSRTGTSRMWF